MTATVTELLREFPKIKKAVLLGETVIIQSKDGNMRITLDNPEPQSLFGSLHGLVRYSDDLTIPTTKDTDWKPSL